MSHAENTGTFSPCFMIVNQVVTVITSDKGIKMVNFCAL